MRRLGHLALLVSLVIPVAGAAAERVGAGSVERVGPELPLEACATDQHKLAVLFLVDVSGSLKTEDPANQRVSALKLAITALSDFRAAESAGDRAFDINVDFVEFGTGAKRSFPDLGEWPELGDDVSDLLEAVDQYQTRNGDKDTDYVSALDPEHGRSDDEREGLVGVRQVLSGAPVGACRLVVWFTDGKLDFDPYEGNNPIWYGKEIRSREAAEEAADKGEDELCYGRDPLADLLRAGEISDDGVGAQLAVVGLGDQSRFSLIKRIAEGDDCGDLPPRGRLYPAANVQDLLFSLQLAVLGNGQGRDKDPETCVLRSDEDCREVREPRPWDYPFRIGAGVNGFNILTLASNPAVDAWLMSPGGEIVELDEAGTTLMNDAGATVITQKLSGAEGVAQVRVDLSGAPEDWAGQWRVRFVTSDENAGSTRNRAAVYVFAGQLGAQVAPDQLLRKGRAGEFLVDLFFDGKEVRRQDLIPTVNATFYASVDGERQPLEAERRSDGRWLVRFTPDEDFDGEGLTVSADLELLVRLDESLEEFVLRRDEDVQVGVVEVRDLPKYPTIDGPISEFSGALSQKVPTATASLTIDGSGQEMGGCVQLTSSSVTSDAENLDLTVRVLADGVPVELNDSCPIRLESGTTKDVVVEVSGDPDGISSEGLVSGALTFRATSDLEGSQFAEFEKKFTLSIVPVYETPIDILRAILLLLGALLLALAVLYLANFATSRLVVGEGAYLVLPVVFREGRLRTVSDGADAPLSFKDEQLQIVGMPTPGRYRSVTLDSVRVSGHTPWWPFSDVSARADGQTSGLIIGNDGTTRRGRRGILGTVLNDAWVFVSSGRPTIEDDVVLPLEGVLTVVVPARPDNARRSLKDRHAAIEAQISDLVALHATTVPTDVEPGGEIPAAPFSAVDPEAEGDEKLPIGGLDRPLDPAGAHDGTGGDRWAGDDGLEEPSRPRRIFGRRRRNDETSAELPPGPGFNLYE